MRTPSSDWARTNLTRCSRIGGHNGTTGNVHVHCTNRLRKAGPFLSVSQKPLLTTDGQKHGHNRCHFPRVFMLCCEGRAGRSRNPIPPRNSGPYPSFCSSCAWRSPSPPLTRIHACAPDAPRSSNARARNRSRTRWTEYAAVSARRPEAMPNASMQDPRTLGSKTSLGVLAPTTVGSIGDGQSRRRHGSICVCLIASRQGQQVSAGRPALRASSRLLCTKPSSSRASTLRGALGAAQRGGYGPPGNG